MEKIIVIGGKGTAVNIAEQIAHARAQFGAGQELLGFAIDDESLGSEINGFPILCKTGELKEKFNHADVKLIFALYRPDVMRERTELLARLDLPPERFTSFVHPLSYIAPSVKMGRGCAILSNASIQSNVVIGHFNIINTNVVIEHDTVLGSNNFIGAAACIGAKVEVGDGNFIGLNTSVREFVKIGDFAFAGMGSNLLSDLESGAVAFGNPAKTRR